ncbi:cell wall-binding repeat-containing protein [Quadrisphaera sp. INWT6]|uniref:cell wall-binding repeat-containing protein n=1 Tax=Quadrisphaera sp. INWT6 TaxID=2596917 RepID=UPI00189243FE|nr:cell wall-binding repeat-containing protein [Quadrisphaera sp. INWT6]MBF5081521.1 cell wall-binding repeat-containing protein [Quadrisphaera sp. INWT6]
MTSSTPRRRTRAAAVTLLAAVAVAGLGATSASAATGVKFDQRTGGATRVETAVESSKALYPGGGSEDVVLVNLSRTVDGLSASYLAGLKNAPILYTDTDGAPQATRDEIKRLGAKRVWLVGGEAVISKDQEKAIAVDYTVKRFGGDDRYATAAAVATAGEFAPERVYITSGTSLADAVTVGPQAWANNTPILLTEAGHVPDATKRALDELGVGYRTVIGGKAVVSDDTYKALSASNRVAGDDRQGTAVAVAEDSVATANFTYAGAALVGGANLNAVDALSASALAGYHGIPILYTATPDDIGAATANYLKKHAVDFTGPGYVFGGKSAVSDKAAEQATGAAQ